MPASAVARQEPTIVGRYAIFDRIGAGGMATVHLGRMIGGAGFSRTVAIKRLHAQFALDPDFVAMFVEEGRVASRIRHPSVIATMDVVAEEGELFIVMEYVEGETLAPMVRAANKAKRRTAPAIASAIIVDALHGLHAAHTAKTEQGEPLCIVHRDISPQNVFVGTDGVGRVLDFGIAKAMGATRTTREGNLKGKLGYMSPEHIAGHDVSPRSDVFGTGIVLWELLVGRHLFQGDGEAALLKAVLAQELRPPSAINAEVSKELDAVVMKALARDPADRFASANEMADALERAVTPANRRAVGEWVESLAGDTLEERKNLVAIVESASLSPYSVRSGVRERASLPRAPLDSQTVEATTMIRPKLRPSPRALALTGAGVALLVCVAAWWLASSSAPTAEIAPATAVPPAASGLAAPTSVPEAPPTGADDVIEFGHEPSKTPTRRSGSAAGASTRITSPKATPAPRAKDGPAKTGGSIYSRE